MGQDQSVTWINSIFANYYSPVKFGGIFHVGVEIGGQEWSYGYTAEGTGVFSTQPLSQAAHHFNQSVQMPQVTMSQDEVDHLLRELEAEWAGPDYDLLGHNCCHFANDPLRASYDRRHPRVDLPSLASIADLLCVCVVFCDEFD